MISIFTTSQDSSLLCNGCAFIASQSFQATVPCPLLDQLLWNMGFPHAGCTSNPQTMVADLVTKQNLAKEIKDADAPTARLQTLAFDAMASLVYILAIYSSRLLHKEQ